MMPNQPNELLRQIGIVAAVAATIGANYLANALPINGVTTGAVAARFDVLFQPAPYVFSIWGLIYVALSAYAIYQARPSLRDDKRLRSLDLPVVLSCAANVGWLLLWHYGQIVASFVAMLVLLGSLVVVYRRLDPERGFAEPGRRLLVHHTFSVYLGWITVASIANLAIMLESLGWSGWGAVELVWFSLAVLGVLAIAAWMTARRADVPFLLTLTWAFVGLGVEHRTEPLVAAVSWIGTAALAVMVALAAVRRGD